MAAMISINSLVKIYHAEVQNFFFLVLITPKFFVLYEQTCNVRSYV